MFRKQKLEDLKEVTHSQIIDSQQWQHQVTKFCFGLKNTHRFANILEIEVVKIQELKNGHIIISTIYGYIIGVVRDSAENFRIITFP